VSFGAVPGTYTIQVIDNDTGSKSNGIVLATGTLTVTDGGSVVPHIDSTSAKAAGDLQVDAGGQVEINGENLATPDSTHVFIGGIDATVTWTSESEVTANVPASLTPGQSYDLYVTNQYGTSNTVHVQVLSVLVSTSGTLTAGNPNPIPYSIAAGGSTGVTVGSFVLQPSGENMSLQQIGLDMPANQSSRSDITHAYVYQGSTLVGTATFAGSPLGTCPPAFTGTISGGCYFATTTISSSAALSPNAQTAFTIKADIAAIGIAAPGNPGDQIVLGLSDAEALGLNSGAIVHSGSAPSQVGVRIFKSYPTVVQIPLPTTSVTGSSQPLMRFSVTASPSGTIGLDEIALALSPSGGAVNVSNFGWYGFTDQSFSQPISGQGAGGLIGAGVTSNAITGVRFFMTPGSNVIEIPAGTTYYFELRGTVSGTGNFSLTTNLYGDSIYSGLFQAGSTGNGNFQWSPNDTTTSRLLDPDWTNGDGVSGLPQNGLTQTLTNPVSTQGGLTISSAQQPPNSLAFAGATIPFTKFTLTNPTPASLSVSGFIVRLFGLISSQALHDVRLYNNTAGGYQGIPVTLDSSGQADIGGQTTLLPGASDTFTVMGDMAVDLSAYAGQTAQIPLTGIDTSGTNTLVVGTLPVNGATQTINASLNACANPAVYGITCWTVPTQTQTTVTSISPTSGSNATQVIITGTGFSSSNYINLIQANHAYAIGSLVPSTNGGTTLSFPLAVPSNTPSGVYTVQVCNGGGNSNACSNSSVTFTLNGTTAPAPTVTYVSNSGGSVTGSYANLPAGSQIVVVNQTSGQSVTGLTVSVPQPLSGSGTLTLTGLPAGTFYLKALDAAGNYLAQSISFTSAGSITTSTGTCTRTISTSMGPPTTISISGGASACAAWCSSQDLEDNVQSTCVYNDLSVSGSGDANLANALTALQSALQALLGFLGK